MLEEAEQLHKLMQAASNMHKDGTIELMNESQITHCVKGMNLLTYEETLC